MIERALIISGGNSLKLPNLDPGWQKSESWSYTVKFPETESLEDVIEDVSKQLIREALRRCGGNQTAASALLRISRAAIWRRVKKMVNLE